MTGPRTLRDVTALQAHAFDKMDAAFGEGDYEAAAFFAAVVNACATVRASGTPSRDRATYYRDTLDVDTYDPPQSEAEYMRDEYERDRERPWRRHDRD